MRFSIDQRVDSPIVKPAEAKAKVGATSRWKRAKVKKINPIVQPGSRVEVDGFVFSKPAGAPHSSFSQTPVAPEKK